MHWNIERTEYLEICKLLPQTMCLINIEQSFTAQQLTAQKQGSATHFTLNTAYYTLYTKHCILHTTHYTAVHCSLHPAH